MWHGRPRRNHDDDMWRHVHPEPSPDTGGVGDECEAFLAGAYIAYLEAHDMPVPPWAHLNRVAHAEPAALVGLLGRDGDKLDGRVISWIGFERLAAREVLGTADPATADGVRALQRQLLVPLELRLQSGEVDTPPTPARFLQLVRAALHRHPSIG